MNDNYKLVFLSTLIPEELQCEVSEKTIKGMQDAACALQWHILDGLYENYQREISLVNILPVSSYPQYYTDAYIKTQTFQTKFSLSNVNVGFFNLKGLRRISIAEQVYRCLLNTFDGIDSGILFVYTLSEAFLSATVKLKKSKPGICICAIVADLPNMSDLSSKTFAKYFSSKLLSHISYKHLNCIDAFVLLTEQMAEYMHISQPFCVMEGIATEVSEFQHVCRGTDNKSKIIMYSGTLHKRFGVLNLVKTFEEIDNSNYVLKICGTGDSESLIKEYAEKDNRIVFLGKLPRKEVLRLQSESTVLVNPRQNIEEFTKYSFPSKTMEYLSSGRPVIAYKLDGIPDEYDKYLIYVKDNSMESLKATIIDTCEKSDDVLKSIGENGKRFVIEQKNPKKQCAKIKVMLDALD